MVKPSSSVAEKFLHSEKLYVIVLSCSKWGEKIPPAPAVVEGSRGSGETPDGGLITSVMFVVSFFVCHLLFLIGLFFSPVSLCTAVSFIFVLGFEKGATVLVRDFVCGSGLAAFLVSNVLIVEVSIEWIEVDTDVVRTGERERGIVVGLGRVGWTLTPARIFITWNFLFV